MWLAALVQDDCETNMVQWESWSERNERQKYQNDLVSDNLYDIYKII